MKWKICFILTEMIIAAILVCACSDEQKAGEIAERRDDALIESVAVEHHDAETEADDKADAVMRSDLYRKGIAREVRLTDIGDWQGPRLEIWENSEQIDFENSSFTHAGQKTVAAEEIGGLPITEPLEMAFYSGAGAWGTYITLHPNGSFVGYHMDVDMLTRYICQFHGQFGKVEKLTDASWLLTLEELELDTGRAVGEEWDETDGGYTVHYVSSGPYGFEGTDGTALKSGAQFLLYSPDAMGHEPGTELYGAMEFQSWMHKYKVFNSDGDMLDCWGLQNMETGHSFFDN